MIYSDAVTKSLQNVDLQIAEIEAGLKAGDESDKFTEIQRSLLERLKEIRAQTIVDHEKQSQQVPAIKEIAGNMPVLIRNIPGSLIDQEFMERLKSVCSTVINEETLSVLAGWQRILGEHKILLRNYEDIVTPDLKGIRSPKNEDLCNEVTRRLGNGVPFYLGWGERSYMARILLQDGPSAFFTCFDAGDIDDHHGNPFASMIVRPTAVQNSDDLKNEFYALSGISLEQLPHNPDRMLDLETLIMTYDLGYNFKLRFSRAERPVAYDYSVTLTPESRANHELERAARRSINGTAAFLIMTGDKESVVTHMHLHSIAAALHAMEGEILTHSDRLIVPYMIAWLQKGQETDLPRLVMPEPKQVIADYNEFARQAWGTSFKGHFSRMQLYEMTIKASATLIDRGDLSPGTRWIAASVVAAARRFNPSLTEKILGIEDTFKLSQLQPELLLDSPTRPGPSVDNPAGPPV